MSRHFTDKELKTANQYVKKCSTSLVIQELQITQN